MNTSAAQRRHRRAAAQAGVDYAAARLTQLETLLADPESWRWLAAHALDVRSTHPPGTPAHDVLTRVSRAAIDVVRLADTQPAG